MAPSKSSQANGEKKGKGRPKGSVKKPKAPKQTKAKVKAAAKKSKEPKNNKTASN